MKKNQRLEKRIKMFLTIAEQEGALRHPAGGVVVTNFSAAEKLVEALKKNWPKATWIAPGNVSKRDIKFFVKKNLLAVEMEFYSYYGTKDNPSDFTGWIKERNKWVRVIVDLLDT
jgi:hypothetical protein